MPIHFARPLVPVATVALAVAVALTLGAPPAPVTPVEQASIRIANELSAAFQRATRVIAPSVVNIISTERVEVAGALDLGEDFLGLFGPPGRDGQLPERQGQGSGVIFREDGYIVTNNHVVEGAERLMVTLEGGARFHATVVGEGGDEETDIAVIKIDAEGLTPARFGDSDASEVGEWVLAVGNPFGLDHTVTAGIISAIGREGLTPTVYGNLIQTDAAINPGNSGGPLVDLEGRVIGLNSAISTRTGGYMGIGFAIPGNMVKSVATSLIEHGKVVRGWLGVTMGDLTPERAKALGYRGAGVEVVDVNVTSPADTAGIAVGDIITAVDGRMVRGKSQLQSMIARSIPGTRTQLTIVRKGQNQAMDVTLGERPPLEELQRVEVEVPALGLVFEPLTEERAAQLGATVDEGVVVRFVAPGSRGDWIGLKAGDIMLRFAGRPTRNLDELREALGAFDPRQGLRIRVHRDGMSMWLKVE